jgi:hypothetical protein
MIAHERALNIFKETVIKETLNDIPIVRRKNLGLHKEETTADATEAFASLCDKAASMQQSGTLGDIATIRFSFLRTELAHGRGIFPRRLRRTLVYDGNLVFCAVGRETQFRSVF